MTFSFSRVTYNEQLVDLEKAGDWLKSIGIETANTRFDEIFKLNKIIVEHHRKNEIQRLIDGYDNLTLWCALTEASSFVEIHKAFKDQKSHMHPRSKLKKLLGGPFLPWDEDTNESNIENRNTLFELETAAKLKKAGAKIIGFDDVDFIFKKTKFNIQCKRLHSEKNIGHNITKAAEQLYKKMKSRPNLKGIISLSIDKLTGKEGLILKVKSAKEVRPALEKLTNAFLIKYRKLWHSLININILGVLLFVHIVAIIEEEPYDFLTTCRDIAFDVVVRQNFIQFNDYNLIIELMKKLQNTV